MARLVWCPAYQGAEECTPACPLCDGYGAVLVAPSPTTTLDGEAAVWLDLLLATLEEV